MHDWLVAQRGGENVLRELCELFPAAPIYTLVHAPGSVDPAIERHIIHTSFIQHLPGVPRRFRQYLPLFPKAIGAFDLRAYDLVVSSSHCVAKGVHTRPGQRHVAYVHTPMRYLWDQLDAYLPAIPGRAVWRPPLDWLAAPLRRWDVRSAQLPDVLLANSRHVARRIQRFWGRSARVVYPPVDVDFFAAAANSERAGFLVAGALVPYKNAELAVRWATERHAQLTVVGDGPEAGRLHRLAGPSVSFVDAVPAAALRDHYSRAEALLFCGEEDFGIVPVEATAAGCPVVALAKGGALETVVAGVNGVHFADPTISGLNFAIERVKQGPWNREVMIEQARRYSRVRFVGDMYATIDELVATRLT